MRKIFFILSVILLSFSSYSQASLNDYKYVIVPQQFDFQSKPNQYRLNELVKYMFKKIGFESFIEGDAIPEDLKSNFCLALRAEVKSKGTFLTKSTITLLDCNKDVVFITREGVSKEKDYSKTYNLSLRDAFKAFEGINYKFNPNNSKYTKPESDITKEKEEIEKLKAEIKELKEEKKKGVSSIEDTNNKQKKDSVKTQKVSDGTYEGFIAKKISNGFKLLNNSPTETITVFESGVKDVFIVKGRDAIIYKKGDNWMYSEANETDIISKKINIRF